MLHQCTLRVLVVTLVACLLQACYCYNDADFFITPFVNDSSCQSESCFTLSQFANISRSNFSTVHEEANITLIILPGNHSLDFDLSLVDLTELSVTPAQSYSHQAEESRILCSLPARLRIENVSVVHIGGVELIGCQIVTISFAKHLHLWNVHFDSSAVLLLNDNYVRIDDSTFHNGQGGIQGGAMAIINNTMLLITNNTYENNRADSGGALYIEESNVTMNECLFHHNVANLFGGGILALNATILGKQCSYFGNSAQYGGVLLALQSEITFTDSHFSNSKADVSGGVMHVEQQSVVVISNSSMEQNHANMFGGVLTAIVMSTVVFIESTFSNNTSEMWGGVIHIELYSVKIDGCTFEHNFARVAGGVISMLKSTLIITFSNNAAVDINRSELNLEFAGRVIQVPNTFGGVIFAHQSKISLYEGNVYRNNTAGVGGTIAIINTNSILSSLLPNNTIPHGPCNLIIIRNIFEKNSIEGGVIYSLGCNISDESSAFQYNGVEVEVFRSPSGATDTVPTVIFADSSIISLNESHFLSNSGATLFVTSSTMTSFSILMRDSQNNGSMYVRDSNVIFFGETTIVNCTQFSGSGGGGITAYQSTVHFHGITKLIGNHAEYGGAMHAIDSKVYFLGEVEIAGNSARRAGGAMFLTRSELTCLGTCNISENTANETGGGIHASSSTVTIKTMSSGLPNRISFISNTADNGGGLYFQANSKLYFVLPGHNFTPLQDEIVTFINNSASLDGGAIYVADDTYSDTCSTTAECFFQIPLTGALKLGFDYEFSNVTISHTSTYLEFSDNSAGRGSVLYGGLLDRCTVSPYSLIGFTVMDGIHYFSSVTESDLEPLLDSISSDPVRVCFCTHRQLNCNYQAPPIRVRKGETFNMTVAAVDHVNHTVSADIISSPTPEGGLTSGQQFQSITANCTTLTFNLQSPHSEERLTMYADGPCKDSELSQRKVIVQFLDCTCPIGFRPSDSANTSCVCMCDPVLADYIRECDPSSGLLQRENTNSWISYADHLGYIIHPHCPFDYCFPSTMKLSINLNNPNGSDAQCNFKRSGLLCGKCTPGYSLSMGTSECMKCQGSRGYGGLIGLLLISVIGGMVLVGLVLFLNITVAVGTINGFIFYANVIAANNNAFLRIVGQRFPSVFIAWMNLDIGFNICVFNGNDAYTKTWIELIFPIYIFIIIVTIIVVSKYSQHFSNFIGMKNPIATLATLILLSYTKILRLMITMLSSTNIKYTNSSDETTVWRPDGNVPYLQGKHVALFLAALLILLVSVPFTLTLLCWQWLLRISNKRFVRHLINTKVQCLVETYCVPFHAEHRYWTGMLLLVRVILYFIAGVEPSGNPQVQLAATAILVGIILFIKGRVQRKVYKKDRVDLLESFLLFNLLALSAFMLCAGDNPTAAKAAAYLATMTTFLLLIVTIGYHVIRYTPLYQLTQKIGIKQFIKEKLGVQVNRPDHPRGVPENRPDHHA